MRTALKERPAPDAVENPETLRMKIIEDIADRKLKLENMIPHSHEWSVESGHITHLEHRLSEIENRLPGFPRENGHFGRRPR